jgi:DNA replication and repair protein RecF
MILKELHLRNFRCFKEQRIVFKDSITLLQGPNGSGKTSIIEALFFLGHLYSWRTSSPREICAFGNDHFYLRLNGVTRDEPWQLQVGLQGKKRLIKFGENPIKSFEEISNHYQLIVLSEDNLAIVQDGPEERRSFIDDAIVLQNPAHKMMLRSYRHILAQRNSLLHSEIWNSESYDIWSQQLWSLAKEIQQERSAYITRLNDAVMHILLTSPFFQNATIQLEEKQSRFSLENSYELFEKNNPYLADYERKAQRTLWGPHLDDFTPLFNGSHARQYASRGQKKRMVTLLKLAQAHMLGQKPIWALDDFMADFDDESIATIFSLIQSNATQLLITSPSQGIAQQCIPLINNPVSSVVLNQ